MTNSSRLSARTLTCALLVAGISPGLTPALAQNATMAPQQPAISKDTGTAAPQGKAIAIAKPRAHRKPHDRVHAAPVRAHPHDTLTRVGAANAAARVEPDRTSWLNAIQQFPYADGALYQIYLAPGQVTDIALQEGEELVGPGPVAAGDTVRWIIGDTSSGQGATRRVHILVKPTRPDLVTNLVINTDRRTYHLELRATPVTYMAGVSWTYPQDQLIALRNAAAAAARAAPVSTGIEVAALNFRYRIDGDHASWRPLRAFDDGRQAYIEFPEGIVTGEMPPVFVLGADGSAELVNYRVQGRYMVIDRLFDAAELRLGTKKTQQRVTIRREDVRRRRGS